MLPAHQRLTTSAQFREVVRRGRRSGGPLLVVHLLVPAPRDVEPSAEGPRAGFVVSKAVGKAVTRTLVKRRLRHLTRERLAPLPPGSLLVVRALPAASEASYADLGAELDARLRRCLGPGQKQVGV